MVDGDVFGQERNAADGWKVVASMVCSKLVSSVVSESIVGFHVLVTSDTPPLSLMFELF